MVCLVYQEPDAAARIAAQNAVIQNAALQTAEGLSVAPRIAATLNVAPPIAAIPNVAIQIVAIRIVVTPNAVIPIAVRVGIRVATPVVGPAPLSPDVRGVEFHAVVPKPAQVVRCVARAYSKEHSRSFPVVARVSPILPASFGLTYPTYLIYLTGRERPQSEADPESQVVPIGARGFAAAEAQVEL